MCWQRGVPSGTSCTRSGVALSQPPLFKPVFPGGQDPVSSRYPGAVTGHAALMNDLGTGPNHGLIQQAAILLTAGAKTDVLRFPRPGHTLRRGWRISARWLEQVPGPGSAASISRSGSAPVPAAVATPECGMPAMPHHPPAADAAAISAAPSSPGTVAMIALVPGRCRAAAAPARAAPAMCGTARTRRRP